MLLWIFAVLVLAIVQALLPGRYLTQQVGTAVQVGARDNLPEPTIALQRSRRALANLQESLPVFLTLAVLSVVLGEQGWLSILGAALFTLARIAHVVCYMCALSPWRSIAYGLSMIGMVLVALPLLGHLWA